MVDHLWLFLGRTRIYFLLGRWSLTISPLPPVFLHHESLSPLCADLPFLYRTWMTFFHTMMELSISAVGQSIKWLTGNDSLGPSWFSHMTPSSITRKRISQVGSNVSGLISKCKHTWRIKKSGMGSSLVCWPRPIHSLYFGVQDGPWLIMAPKSIATSKKRPVMVKRKKVRRVT